jgi:hypothetical protein
MTKTAILTGDTFRHKAGLKGDGWKWSPERKAWTREVAEDATPEDVIRDVRLIPGVRNRGGFFVAFAQENSDVQHQ